MKTRVFTIFAHIIASLVFAYSLLGFNHYQAESAVQETVVVLWQIKYILIAMFIELGALSGYLEGKHV